LRETGLPRVSLECGASCCTFFRSQVAIELVEQGISVFLCPVGQVGDKSLDLLAGGVAQCLGAAEIRRVRLYQGWIELMLADDLAKTIPDCGTPPQLPFAGWGGTFRDSRDGWRGSAKDPSSSTEQLPIP